MYLTRGTKTELSLFPLTAKVHVEYVNDTLSSTKPLQCFNALTINILISLPPVNHAFTRQGWHKVFGIVAPDGIVAEDGNGRKHYVDPLPVALEFIIKSLYCARHLSQSRTSSIVKRFDNLRVDGRVQCPVLCCRKARRVKGRITRIEAEQRVDWGRETIGVSGQELVVKLADANTPELGLYLSLVSPISRAPIERPRNIPDGVGSH